MGSALSRSRRRARSDGSFGYMLAAPAIVGFALFGVFPLLEVFRLSTSRVNSLSGDEEFVGLENYTRLIEDPSMPTIMGNTAFFVITLSVLGTVLALALALLVNQQLKGIGFFRAAIFLPALISMVAWTIVWGYILQPKGLLDAFLVSLGASPQPWLREHWLTLTILVAVQALKNVGLNMMILLAALQSVPAEVKEAARMDGAGPWRTFRNIILPEISPSVLMVFMLMIVGSFKVFDVIYLLTQGGPGADTTVLSYYIYVQAFERNDIGYASALSVVLFLLVAAITTFVWQLRKKVVPYA